MFRSDWVKHPAPWITIGWAILLTVIRLYVGPEGHDVPGPGCTQYELAQELAACATVAGTDHTSPLREGQHEAGQGKPAPPYSYWGDSPAQWAMAAATAIGVLLLWLTLEATRAAVGEAKSATLAAQDAVEATRETGRAQVRAYLEFDITDINISERPGSDPPQTRIEFIGKLRNTGQSPAHAHRILFDVEAEEFFSVQGFNSRGSDFTQLAGSMISIASGGRVNQSIAKTIPVREEDIWSKKRTVRLMYVIRYTDVFDEDVSGFICSGTIQQIPKTGKWGFVPSKIDRIEKVGE